MSALKFQKVLPGLYTAIRDGHWYEIEKVAGHGWQVRHGSGPKAARGEPFDPVGGYSPKLGDAKQLALNHLHANV